MLGFANNFQVSDKNFNLSKCKYLIDISNVTFPTTRPLTFTEKGKY